MTVLHVKCKTKKCGKPIPVDRPFASGETRDLKCPVGHSNRYGASSVEPRTAKIMKRS